MAETKAIIGLIINIIGFVGVGSLIGGRTKAGIWQLVLLVLSWVLLFGGFIGAAASGSPALFILSLLGWLLAIGNWIWGLVTGISMLHD